MTTRILVIHDENRRRNQLRECLEPPHKVDVCGSVQEAMAALKSTERASLTDRPFDLVLSAVHLDSPDDLSVFDLLKWTRRDAQLADLPFVLLDLEPSPHAKQVIDAIRAAGTVLGATDYIIIEQFHPDHLRRYLNGYLAQDDAIVGKKGSSHAAPQ